MSADRRHSFDDNRLCATCRTITAPQHWRGWVRVVVSIALALHLTAILVAPLSVPPSSSLAQESWRIFGRYLQLLYLNHGYHFFAPEPAQSTLLAYNVLRSDGSRVEGRIPNREIQPRLLYHRHFMLTEFLAFPRSPEDQERLHRSYAGHLCSKYQGGSVSLSRITHYPAPLQAVRDGATLTEPESYTEEPLGTFQCDEL